ncbi:MAG: anti-sigma factor [Betaproteobacteria bacterium]|nr:anti-sigma factor [Betaproteobacteria bacterium]
MNDFLIREEELQQYIDGRLPVERIVAFEALLAQSPAAAEQVRRGRELTRLCHTEFDSVLNEAVPTHLTAAATHRSLPWLAIAASVACLAIGGSVGWFAHGELVPRQIVVQVPPVYREAAVAHVVYTKEVRHPVEVTADQHEHLVTWLSKRLGAKLKVPNLHDAGYDLVGGRLLPSPEGYGAQFMFQDANGKRLTLYVCNEKTGNADTAFRYAQEGPVGVFYWIDGVFGYALSGEMERDKLLTVANNVYKQLNP